MSNMLEMGKGAEFERIRKMWRVLGSRAVGGGDDCAIVQLGAELMAISVDCSVEGAHFERGWLSHREMGWRAGAAALSDIAAVAAAPRGILVGLGVSQEMPDEFVSDIMDGVGAVADSVGAKVWGGDLYKSDTISISVTVVGDFDGAPVRRKGASVGDSIWVTGLLGGSATAVSAFLDGRQPEESCRARFVNPEPRVAQARWLGNRGATAMIDISDGLLSDLGHLVAASSVAGDVDSERIPRLAGADLLDSELTGGEDYELLFTMPDGDTIVDEFESQFGLSVTCIGQIRKGTGVTIARDGEPYTPAPGFRHF